MCSPGSLGSPPLPQSKRAIWERVRCSAKLEPAPAADIVSWTKAYLDLARCSDFSPGNAHEEKSKPTQRQSQRLRGSGERLTKISVCNEHETSAETSSFCGISGVL